MSQHNESLGDKEFLFFQHSDDIKVCSRILQTPCPQECYGNVGDAVNIKEIAEESDLTSDSKIHLFNQIVRDGVFES